MNQHHKLFFKIFYKTDSNSHTETYKYKERYYFIGDMIWEQISMLMEITSERELIAVKAKQNLSLLPEHASFPMQKPWSVLTMAKK